MTLVHLERGHILTAADDLSTALLPRERDPASRLLGSELELFLVHEETLRPIDYPTHQKILTRVAQADASYKPSREGGILTHLIGEGPESGTVICGEPGCQIELARKPVETVHEAVRETDKFLALLASEAEKEGLKIAIPGLFPLCRGAAIPLSGRPRYQAFQTRINAVTSGNGHDLSRGTCALQTNIDTLPDNWAATAQAALGIQPVIVALFGNSPVFDGVVSKAASNRAILWFEEWGTNTDAFRRHILSSAFSAKSFEHYIRNQELPILGDIELPAGTTFNALLNPATKPSVVGRPIVAGDFANVLGAAFAPIKIKTGGIIELRGADGSFELRHALEALACGLFYDPRSLAALHETVFSFSLDDHQDLATLAPRHGLRTKFGKKKTWINTLALELCDLAEAGLKRRNLGEEIHLRPLQDIAEGRTPSLAEATFTAAQKGEPLRDIFRRSLVGSEAFSQKAPPSPWTQRQARKGLTLSQH